MPPWQTLAPGASPLPRPVQMRLVAERKRMMRRRRRHQVSRIYVGRYVFAQKGGGWHCAGLWRPQECLTAVDVSLWSCITKRISIPRIHIFCTAQENQAGNVSTAPGCCGRQGASSFHLRGSTDVAGADVEHCTYRGHTIYPYMQPLPRVDSCARVFLKWVPWVITPLGCFSDAGPGLERLSTCFTISSSSHDQSSF